MGSTLGCRQSHRNVEPSRRVSALARVRPREAAEAPVFERGGQDSGGRDPAIAVFDRRLAGDVHGGVRPPVRDALALVEADLRGGRGAVEDDVGVPIDTHCCIGLGRLRDRQSLGETEEGGEEKDDGYHGCDGVLNGCVGVVCGYRSSGMLAETGGRTWNMRALLKPCASGDSKAWR